MLNLNNPPEPTQSTAGGASKGAITPSTGPPVWKILVLDQHTQDVLATVLRVTDLRDAGVTLHVYVSWLSP